MATESSTILNSAITSNFLIQFETDLIPNIEYFVRDVSLPGYSISTNTVYSYSAQPIEYYGGMLTFNNDISFDIIIDEKFQTRRNIDNYMFSIRDQKDGKLNQKAFDICLYLLTNKSNPTAQIRYSNFLMKTVSDIKRDVTTNDYSFFTISGSIRYYKWII
jgi:hypothetical protein